MMILVALLVLLAARRGHAPPAWQRMIRSNWSIAVVAVVTAGVQLYLLGGNLDLPARISDEASYRLQASLLAEGRWTDSMVTFREPFRQMHVVDSPTVASKYFPGHALMLTPGFAIGLPFLVPLILTTLSGTLVFILARQLIAPAIAPVVWLVWLASTGTVDWHLTWFSQTTSGFLMLAGWYILVRDRNSSHSHLVLGTVIGLLAITRPLTAVTFAIPVAFLMLHRAVASREIAPILLSGFAASLVLVILPVWSMKTTGNLRLTPTELYTAQHMPWDRIGFGLIDTVAPIPLVDDQAQVEQYFLDLHQTHRPVNYLLSIGERLGTFAGEHLSNWRIGLLPFGLLGLAVVPGWMVGALVLQFLAYGFYAHASNWTIYYAELGPVLILVVCAGVWRGMEWLHRQWEQRVTDTAWTVVLGAFVVAASVSELSAARARLESRTAGVEAFRTLVEELPDQSIVFVRYGPNHDPHHALITNLGPRAVQPVLIAYDRGMDDNLNVAKALGRTAFHYSEAESSLKPIPAGSNVTSLTQPPLRLR